MTAALAGKRVVITRPRTQADAMATALRGQGAIPILFPTIAIVPVADTTGLDRAIDGLGTYDWVVFTSVNGVSVFAERVEARTKRAISFERARVAAVGPATAEELKHRGVTPQFVPTVFVADSIPDGLGDVRGLRILLPLAARARTDLASELIDRGADVEVLALYDTVAAEVDADAMADLDSGVDAVTFTSASSVEHFVEMTADRTALILKGAVVTCIGPITAKTAERLGLRVRIVARRHTTDGIIEALAAHFSDLEPSLADA